MNITSHLVLCSTTHIHAFTVYTSRYSFYLSSLCLKLMRLSLSLPSSFHKLQEDVELEWLRQTEVLYYRLECSHSNAVPQLKHNPWSLRCQQQHLQKMKENAKHRNQYSILSALWGCWGFFHSLFCQHSISQWNETELIVPGQRTWHVPKPAELPGHLDTCLCS